MFSGASLPCAEGQRRHHRRSEGAAFAIALGLFRLLFHHAEALQAGVGQVVVEELREEAAERARGFGRAGHGVDQLVAEK